MTEQSALETASEIQTEGEIADGLQEQETQGREDAGEVAEPTFVEVEYDGETYEVPQKLKDALLRQADYTRKTQTLSDERRQWEEAKAQNEQLLQIKQQALKGYADLAGMDARLAQYQDIDWQRWSESEAMAAQKGFMEFTQLRDQRQALANGLQQYEHQQIADLAKRRDEGLSSLGKDIPNWNEGLQKDLYEHGKTYGFAQHELGTISDPRAVKVLHDAYQYRKMVAKANQQTEKPKPTAKIAGKSSKPAELSDEMPFTDWLKLRNKQLARKRG